MPKLNVIMPIIACIKAADIINWLQSHCLAPRRLNAVSSLPAFCAPASWCGLPCGWRGRFPAVEEMVFAALCLLRLGGFIGASNDQLHIPATLPVPLTEAPFASGSIRLFRLLNGSAQAAMKNRPQRVYHHIQARFCRASLHAPRSNRGFANTQPHLADAQHQRRQAR